MTARAADSKPLTRLAPYFGAKARLAPRIVEELGPHAAYWEPFCGSMATLLSKPAASMETVNDLNGDLVNLARVIQDDWLGPKFYRSVRRMLMCRPIVEGQRERLQLSLDRVDGDAPDLGRAIDYFALSWQGRNGVVGSKHYNHGFSHRFTISGGAPGLRWTRAVDSIPAWRRRMRRVVILHEDAFALLPRIEDAPEVAIYADPPYVCKGAKYLHDFEESDHARLADALARFCETRVVVSYYDHPAVRQLYAGWTFVECGVSKSMLNPQRRGASDPAPVAPEVLIVNGSSRSDAQRSPLFEDARDGD